MKKENIIDFFSVYFDIHCALRKYERFRLGERNNMNMQLASAWAYFTLLEW